MSDLAAPPYPATHANPTSRAPCDTPCDATSHASHGCAHRSAPTSTLPTRLGALLGGVSLCAALAACAGRTQDESAAASAATTNAGQTAPQGAASRGPLPVDAIARAQGRDEPLPVNEAQQRAGIPHVRFRVELGQAPSRGPDDAPVTIVMFSDFECPYCLRGLRTVEQLEREYPGKIRFVYKTFPIDHRPNAMAATLVAHAAREQGKYWAFHDLIFGGPRITLDVLRHHAQQIGLEASIVDRELDELTHAPDVLSDLRQGKRLDVTSTPVFFINGRKMRGAKAIQAFRMMVDQELSLASGERERGAITSNVYDHLTRFGYTEVRYEGARRGLDDSMIYPIPVDGAPQLGPADAPITIVAFEDFECPYCTRGHATVLALRARYGDRLRVVYRHFPLPGHPLGALAARGAIFAQAQGKFWEFHDRVYAFNARFEVADLHGIAKDLGFDKGAFAAALTDSGADTRIMEDMQLGRSLGVSGTPAYFINGRPLVGARPEFDFRMIIAEEERRAERLLSQGIAPAHLYGALVGLDASR